jgi:hypothetical protein
VEAGEHKFGFDTSTVHVPHLHMCRINPAAAKTFDGKLIVSAYDGSFTGRKA